MFLLKIGVPQTCFKIALTWSSSKGQTLDTQKNSSGATYKISPTISSRKNGYPCKRNYNDRSSGQVC